MERVLIRDASGYSGKEIKLAGWVNNRRDHGKLIFLEIRDRSSLIQAVVRPDIKDYGLAKDIRSEDVLEIVGEVAPRPKGMENPKIPTGSVEFKIKKIKILAKAETLPIDIYGEGYETGEEKRMKYRYLDLRRPRLLKNLENRHKVNLFIRQELTKKGFIEIETPILTRSTPEGARDFVVPSRLQPGSFYALPQSPQQYKQLLMVSGVEKYFQIARCFRDEDPRGDRQPEFTQLDIEIGFATQEEILNLVEELYIKIAEEIFRKKVYQKPFPRLSYDEAVLRFGNDKFDLRRSKDSNALAFAWIVNFPLFEKTETKEIAPSHHPFTAPKDEYLHLLESKKAEDWFKIRSWQHDLVCNGYEIGGGSIRITNPEIQSRIFEILGYTKKEIKEKFGHLLEAFRYGAPPHGGIALGLDRLVAILQNEPNIREVMAFPKTGDNRDLMMNSPSEITKEQLKELNLKIERNKKNKKPA